MAIVPRELILALLPAALLTAADLSLAEETNTCVVEGDCAATCTLGLCGGRYSDRKAMEKISRGGTHAAAFVNFPAPRQIEVKVRGAHSLIASWSQPYCHSCTLNTTLDMTWRVRVSTDKHFQGLGQDGKGAIGWFVAPSLIDQNMTITGSTTVSSSPLWLEPIYIQVQIFSRRLKLGGKWSAASARWTSASDCANLVEFDHEQRKESFVLNNVAADPATWECIKLPDGAFGGANASMRELLPLRGWGPVPWAKDTYAPFSECPFPGDCVGVGHQDWTSNMTEGSCKEGTEQLLCATCAESYNREAGICLECSSADKVARIVFGVIFFILPVSLLSFVFADKIKKLCEWRHWLHPCFRPRSLFCSFFFTLPSSSLAPCFFLSSLTDTNDDNNNNNNNHNVLNHALILYSPTRPLQMTVMATLPKM